MKMIAWISAILAAVLSLTAAKVYRDRQLPIDIDDSSTYVHTTRKDWIEYLMIPTEQETESVSETASETEIMSAGSTTECRTEPKSSEKEEIPAEQGEIGEKSLKIPKQDETEAAPTLQSSSGERYRITAYIPDEEWGYRTSTGVTSRHLQTCAVDPNVIPLGSTVVVYGDNGQVLELFACDIGGGVKGKHIDIFYDGTEAEAYDWLFRFGEYQIVEIK